MSALDPRLPVYAANRAGSRNAFLDRWAIDQKPNLEAINSAALDLLSAIERQRDGMYMAKEVAGLDSSTTDLAACVADMLADLHGALLTEADEIGIDCSALPLDLSELTKAYETWKERSKARGRI